MAQYNTKRQADRNHPRPLMQPRDPRGGGRGRRYPIAAVWRPSSAVVVFTGLSLVALGLGLLARRYSGHALAIGLIGLLSLTTASTWIISAALDSAGQN